MKRTRKSRGRRMRRVGKKMSVGKNIQEYNEEMYADYRKLYNFNERDT